jgi:hypothetical protein
LESRMIHECLDFVLKPLKKAAEIGIMMSDPAGSLRHVFTPLAAYMVDVQEALLLAAVAGKTSHLTMANYKQFGDPFRHEPRTTSTTLAQLHALEQKLNPWDLVSYVKAAKKTKTERRTSSILQGLASFRPLEIPYARAAPPLRYLVHPSRSLPLLG